MSRPVLLASLALLAGGCDACAPEPYEHSFEAGELRDAEGHVVHTLAQTGDRLVLPVDAPPGRFGVEVWARSTAADGQPGRLRLTSGWSVAGELDIPEGPAGPVFGEFDLSGDVEISFMNDLWDPDAEPPRDRNIDISRVRITRPPARAGVLEAAATVLEAAATATAPEPRDPAALRGVAKHLVVVSIDTLRADHTGPYGYERPTTPNLDALAGGGVVFDRAVSASHWTLPSHTSLFTGLYPHQHGAARRDPSTTVPAEAMLLAERLHEHGFTTRASVAGIWVDEAHGFDRGFDVWEQGRVRAQQRFERACALLDDPGERTFLFVHTFEVHEPLDPPERFHRWAWPDGDEPADRIWRRPLIESWFTGRHPTQAELDGVVGLYDEEILATDDALGGLVRCLAERELLAETLVVVTSDHGETFLEHGTMGHGELFPEHIRVPLIMAHPALEDAAVDRVGQMAPAVDVLPTLLELLGLPQDEGLPGHSLVPAMAGRPLERAAVAYSTLDAERWAAVTDEGQLVLRPGEFPRWYEHTDPIVDVAGTHAAQVEAARLEVERVQQLPVLPLGEAVDNDQELLRELGYVE